MTEDKEKDLLADADNAYYATDYAQAIMLYEQVLSLSPNNQRATEQLKKAQLSLFADSNRERLPAEAVQHFRRARSYIAAKDYNHAITALSIAIEVAKNAGILYPDAEKLLSSLKYLKVKVFISYSRSDIETASDIYQLLHEKGYSVWMDKFNLLPGQNWKLEIYNNIKSSDFFIACLSNNSVSKRGYVQKELKEAISVLDEMPEGEIYLIPIRLDDCLVPSFLTNKHWLDWSAPNAKDYLLKALNTKKES
jgi:tetratricopeptide (TPR) repeat protein